MQTIKRHIQQKPELDSLADSCLEISRLMDDPGSDIDDFISIIRFNPELSNAILNIANSTYSGLTGKIHSISRAVNLIGMGQLHNFGNQHLRQPLTGLSA